MKNLNKKTKDRVINLLTLVADGERLPCSRCGLTEKCLIYQYTNTQIRNKLRKGEYISTDDKIWPEKTPAEMRCTIFRGNITVELCYKRIIAEVSKMIVEDFEEVRIG